MYYTLLCLHIDPPRYSSKSQLNDKYSIGSYASRIQNPTNRFTISKLRTESHCILSESNVYLNRLLNCKNCTMGTQEEPYHFILECQRTWMEARLATIALHSTFSFITFFNFHLYIFIHIYSNLYIITDVLLDIWKSQEGISCLEKFNWIEL